MANWLDFKIPIIGIVLYILNLLMILGVIFFERKSSSATFAWILVLTFIPVIGIVLYFLLNQNFARMKINKLLDDEEKLVKNYIGTQITDIEKGQFVYNNPAAEKWESLVKLNLVYGEAAYTDNDLPRIITDGKELMSALIEDIRNAEQSIDVEFFIIKNDEIGMSFINELTKKARQGVKVRLLVDALGSRQINNTLLADFIDAGGEVAYFFKPKLRFVVAKINFRNHRKIVVIDDVIGYTGGFNIAREYVGLKAKFGYWRDTHLRLIGDSVIALKERFVLDWRFTTKENIEIPFDKVHMAAKRAAGDFKKNRVGIQVVSCGPESPKEEVKRGFLKMITNAKETIYIQTPYFVPDPAILEALKMAAQSGVDVRIMIPPKPDHPFVYWATYSYIGELLKDGAKAYIYKKGFLHSKTLVVDSEVVTIGSTNFDIRSFKLNFETNAFIYDNQAAIMQENIFMDDMKHSTELTYEQYLKRGTFIKFKEALGCLLAGIL